METVEEIHSLQESMSDEVLKLLRQLREYEELHLKLGKYLLQAYDGAYYPLDILAVAAMNRSINLLDGFCDLLEKKNFIAAAPLVRLQLDNCLRFFAAFIVDEPHNFAISVLDGIPVRKLKDKEGQLMRDRYLAEQMSIEYPWILNVYEQTSGYIHLSEKHIFNSMTVGDEERGKAKMKLKISREDSFVSDEVYKEAILSFKSATDVFFKYIHGWAYTKDNPEIVQRMKDAMG